ncbi:MAG: NAD-dependent epimerase/dehydratase family protein [Parvularculaceae bacterium]
MADKEDGMILVTGAAGFIGFHVARALLDQGRRVVGVDSLNYYYPPALKRARLAELTGRKGFSFHEIDIAVEGRLAALAEARDIDLVIHLAAQAGVRYSIDHPFAYTAANVTGHLAVLEFARHAPRAPRVLYASSSSVYGASAKRPFTEGARVDEPESLYAATKRAGELMSETYARLYAIPQIGLRFFTVYGPWGRPDMAYWLFTENILAGKPIRLFDKGVLERDFTYIDDIVDGVLKVALLPMKLAGPVPHRIYNIGDNRPEKVTRLVEIIEKATGKKAEIQIEPMQKGDVRATFADISALAADYGYAPKTTLEMGIPRFVEWYREYHK